MRIEFDNIWAYISDVSRKEDKVLTLLNGEYCVPAPGAKYVKHHQTYLQTRGERGWDGVVRLIRSDNRFLSGLLPNIVARLAALGVSPELIDNRLNLPAFSTGSVSVNLRPYQWDCVRVSAKNIFNNTWWPRGVIKIATGGGKTEVAVALYQYLPVPTLFIVDKKTLVNQAVNRFKKYNIDAGQLGDGVKDPKTNGITVATIQTLNSMITKKKDLSWLNNIQQVFFDEAHMIASKIASGNTFVRIAELLPNALMRWGLTATPFMKDEYSNALLRGVTGDLLYEISSKDLIRLEFLTPPTIIMVPVPKIPKLPKIWADAYDNGILLNDARNILIIEQMKKVPKPGFVFTNKVAHANIIQSKAFAAGLGVLPVLDYKSPTKLREATVAGMLAGKYNQIICTKIFDQGFDIPELRSIILAGGGKSPIASLQRIGRLLRIDDSKTSVTLIDFADSTGILARHAKIRKELWISEGYNVKGV